MLACSAIIMAAGYSRRMTGVNKLFLSFNGKTLLERTLETVKEAPFTERILVISPENLTHVSVPEQFKIVINHQADQGQSSSVRLGTQAAEDSDAYLYLTGDQPLLTVACLVNLLEAGATEKIVIPVDKQNKPSSPVLFGKVFRTELLTVQGDQGGRTVRDAHPNACQYIQVAYPDQLLDIDTPEDWQEFRLLYDVK